MQWRVLLHVTLFGIRMPKIIIFQVPFSYHSILAIPFWILCAFFVQRFSNLDQSMLPLFEYGGYSDAPNPIKINQRIAKFF